jgi:hypothetical protein
MSQILGSIYIGAPECNGVSTATMLRILITKALVGFRGDGERAHVTSASIKEPSKAFPRLRVL